MPTMTKVGTKNKGTAALLGILLGGLGAHKFYLGQPGLGLLYLLFSWTGLPSIIGFFEGLAYLALSNETFAERYS
jgi:TM2 domain-containing membrane protein YozV